MIDPVSYVVLILVVLGLSHATLVFRFSPGNRMFWCIAPGMLLLFITHPAALALAFAAIAFNIAVYGTSRILGNDRVNARLPYLILLLLFVPDILDLLWDAPILWLGSAFFIIRQMMTTTQAIKKKAGPRDYFPALAIASFLFAALPSGPVFNGLDVLKALRERRRPNYKDGLYRIFEGFVFLFAVAGFLGMAVQYAHFRENMFFEQNSLIAYGTFHFLFLPLSSFGFLFATFYGYSRMAEGTALVLGFSVPQNFNKPHLASDVGDYWKRWHRSMADFVIQYIYLPLVVTSASSKLALICAFVFMGLWHNLSVNFLIWGLGHGLALAYVLPWAKKKKVNPLMIRVLSLAYVVFLSAIAHGVWFT